jgi:5-methylcytosine-specific restriction endonuclease McrA
MPVSENIREQVRTRAKNRCEYCLKFNGIDIVKHQIDHIRAIKHRGEDSLSNLALACSVCNLMKGDNLAGWDDITDDVVRLYHPRIDKWSEHFEMDNAFIMGLTPIGRVTVYVLDMNNPFQLWSRKVMLDAGLF